MKIRVKFRKYGVMRFIGHLDVMRYFQKAIRRAEIDICYSEGFSPHMIMSFASPLGVGLTSDGEYFDIEIGQELSSASAVERLNKVMAEGVEVLSFRQIPEGKAANAMSLVAAADYEVRFREGCEPAEGWKERFQEFMAQPAISVVKKTKKGEQELDIRSLIYKYQLRKDCIFFQLSAGSAANLKPELVMEAFGEYAGLTYPEFPFRIHRLEVYADQGKNEKHIFIALENLGTEF